MSGKFCGGKNIPVVTNAGVREMCDKPKKSESDRLLLEPGMIFQIFLLIGFDRTRKSSSRICGRLGH
jgi:hypothetical protein